MKYKIPVTICRYYHNVAIVLLFSFIAASANAQKFATITGLTLNNTPVNSINMNIFPPGKGGNKTVARINDRLESGTRVIIPPHALITLQSPGGSQVVKSTQANTIEYTVEFTAQGENHSVKGFGAQIDNNVKKILGYNYRNTNEKGTTAASKGTMFTFTDLSIDKNEKAAITTTEGTINIIDKIPCTINGEPVKNSRKGGVTTKSVSRTQSAGDDEFVSTDKPWNVSDVEAAIDIIMNEINSKDIDPEDIADDLMCLGDLYMDNEQAAKAIQPYSRAAEYYLAQYGDDDLSTLEARLSMAQAYAESDNDEKATAISNECIDILNDILDADSDDMDFAKQDNDTDAIYFICDEITDVYDFLGWAYDITGDDAQSEAYYQKSEAGCK